jgi:hypothetical protein
MMCRRGRMLEDQRHNQQSKYYRNGKDAIMEQTRMILGVRYKNRLSSLTNQRNKLGESERFGETKY